jgi:hypothetical protein
MTKAYYISGHGLESHPRTSSFKVPPGCVIAVLAHKGELISAATGTMQKICSTHAGILKNPLAFTAELTEAFLPWGAMAFYKEGDICPNFMYNLDACYSPEDEPYNCELFGAGIIDIDSLQAISCPRYGLAIDSLYTFDVIGGEEAFFGEQDTTSFETYYDHYINKVINIIGEMYSISILPTPSSVISTLNLPAGRAAVFKVFEDLDEQSTIDGTIADVDSVVLENAIKAAKNFLKANLAIWVSQKHLCRVYPGVYYNFVCRVDPTLPEGNALFHSIPNISTFHNVRNPNLVSYRSATVAQRNHIRSHISEALLHRRPAIRNYYKEQLEGKKSRKTRAKRNFSHYSMVKQVSHRSTRRSSKK